VRRGVEAACGGRWREARDRSREAVIDITVNNRLVYRLCGAVGFAKARKNGPRRSLSWPILPDPSFFLKKKKLILHSFNHSQ
jgi:hypothetical protein